MIVLPHLHLLQFTNSIPLFHGYPLAPTAELALQLLDTYCVELNMKITAIYYIPSETIPDEYYENTTISKFNIIYDKIYASLCATYGEIPLLILNNDAFKQIGDSKDSTIGLFSILYKDYLYPTKINTENNDEDETIEENEKNDENKQHIVNPNLERTCVPIKVSKVEKIQSTSADYILDNTIIYDLQHINDEKITAISHLLKNNMHMILVDFDDFLNYGTSINSADWMSNTKIDYFLNKGGEGDECNNP